MGDAGGPGDPVSNAAISMIGGLHRVARTGNANEVIQPGTLRCSLLSSGRVP
jgi:hypothetical protein